MSNEADYDMCITTDLTIEIDEPTTTIVESFEAISVGKTLPKIGPPKSRDEALALCKIGEDVVMDDLPKNMKEDFCSHLNLPSYGTSLRNWETVAAKLGGNLDFIMGLRALKDPTLELITRYRNFKVNVFLEAVAAAGRIDTLVSMRKYAKLAIRHVQRPYQNFQPTYSGAPTDSACSTMSFYPDSCVILVTHYEEKKTTERREYKKFILNLRDRLNKLAGVEIVDLADVDTSENFSSSISAVFQRARHIIVCLNQTYCRLLGGIDVPRDDYGRAVQALHELTNNEYTNNGSRNRRFRPLIMEDMDLKSLPIGWITATTHFRWADDFMKLVDRVSPKDLPLQTM